MELVCQFTLSDLSLLRDLQVTKGDISTLLIIHICEFLAFQPEGFQLLVIYSIQSLFLSKYLIEILVGLIAVNYK